MAKNSDKNSIAQIGDSLDLYTGDSTEAIKNSIVTNILYKMYKNSPKPHSLEVEEMERDLRSNIAARKRFDPEYDEPTEAEIKQEIKELANYTEEKMNERIASALKQRFPSMKGKPLSDGNVSATQLIGPPGHGKTTIFKEAGKDVAKLLGLNYKENIPDDQDIDITKKDFVFVSMEMSGENTAVSIGGIPVKVETEEGKAFMSKLVSKRIAFANKASGGVFLLDDFTNAGASVQNIGLAITEEGRFQGLSIDRLYVGLTANLGALDGTHTNRQSTAIRGRVKSFYVEDSLDDFIDRVQSKYNDEYSDVMILGFLKRNPNLFSQMPDTKKAGGFPAPRNWEKVVQEARMVYQWAGGPYQTNPNDLKKNLKRVVNQFIGEEAMQFFDSYVDSLMSDADPIARELIETGNLDMKRFTEARGSQFAQTGAFFLHQFGCAMADYLIRTLLEEEAEAKKKGVPFSPKSPTPRMTKAITSYSKGLSELIGSEFNFALDYLKNKMANQLRGEGWSMEVDGAGPTTKRNLHMDTKMLLITIMTQRETNMSKEQSQEAAKMLAEANKWVRSARKVRG